ncbi:MAG TPA: hypothetical protein VKR43_06955 [Bryobacteraceae bacterium]|nr:hypothetical protein [Bryobacteraceae bacterium]
MRTLIKSVLFLTVLANVAPAADKPNFSGDWTLDASKSEFGPMPAPASMTRKIDHSDPGLTVTQATTGGPQGDQTVTMKYSTDGKETVNQLMGNDVKATASWDGSALVIAQKADFGGNEIKLTYKWTLSADGKTLTDAEHIALPQGEFDLTFVMIKK